MTRRMVNEGADVYRVVVVWRKVARNPDYEQGNGQPYWILLDETGKYEYGPYNQIGSAKAILTKEKFDRLDRDKLAWGVVDGWIEKATTTWERVDLGGR